MSLQPLSQSTLEPLVRIALAEDLGEIGDITTNAIVPADQIWEAALVTRKAGVVAGLELARLAFVLCDASLQFEIKKADGTVVMAGDVLAVVKGPARALLTGERTALNFLCHLSGIASATHALVQAAKPHKARICDTRKTTPGLRVLEKYAVRAGGGSNHRFGLYDAVLIKDNHIAVAGSITKAVEQARAAVGKNIRVELEVDTLVQLQEALSLPLDAVLLDNMDIPTLTAAVTMVGGRFETEASGHVTTQNVNAIAVTGVDVISSGWLTHSAPILDVGLDRL